MPFAAVPMFKGNAIARRLPILNGRSSSPPPIPMSGITSPGFAPPAAVAQYRDGAKALAAAKLACELTGYKEAASLDTLAAACAEAGDFASAIKWEQKAIELKTDANEKADYGERLMLYQHKKPFREEKP